MKFNTQIKRPALLAAFIVTTAAATIAAPTHAQMAGERAVNPGESIQAAINAAQPGDTITIRPGVYREQVLITKDRLTLRGFGVRLEPPATTMPNACDASNKPAPVASGICIAGTFNADGSVADPVENITLEGIGVKGFPGAGISAEAARNLTLRGVEATKNGFVGLFTRFSSQVTVQASVSNDNGDTGIWFVGGNDDKAIANTAQRNQGEGITFLETHGGVARGNTVMGNCMGIGVVNLDVLPTNTSDISIRDNIVARNNRLCPRNQYGQGNPQFEGIGIAVAGGQKIDLRNNVITGHATKDETDLPPGGIVIIDTTALGGAKPADVTVAENVLRNNAQVDLFNDGTGSNIVFNHNTCKASQPAGLC